MLGGCGKALSTKLCPYWAAVMLRSAMHENAPVSGSFRDQKVREGNKHGNMPRLGGYCAHSPLSAVNLEN
jgi:hypothetical protein